MQSLWNMFCQCDASKPSHRLCLAHRLTVFNCFFHLLCDKEIEILTAKYLPDLTINYPHCVWAFLLNMYFNKERKQHCKSIISIVSKQIHFPRAKSHNWCARWWRADIQETHTGFRLANDFSNWPIYLHLRGFQIRRLYYLVVLKILCYGRTMHGSTCVSKTQNNCVRL